VTRLDSTLDSIPPPRDVVSLTDADTVATPPIDRSIVRARARSHE